MRIKEVEELLNIDRETVRFYIREGLIEPQQGSNRYRNYTDEDIRQLKKILIMRDLEVSVEDIREVLRGNKDLGKVLKKSKQALERKQAQLISANAICSELMDSDNADFDPDSYFSRREQMLS